MSEPTSEPTAEPTMTLAQLRADIAEILDCNPDSLADDVPLNDRPSRIICSSSR